MEADEVGIDHLLRCDQEARSALLQWAYSVGFAAFAHVSSWHIG